jgi:hypothetical protein
MVMLELPPVVILMIAAGRKRVGWDFRELIFRMVAENPTCGASSVHGDLIDTMKTFGIQPKRTGFRHKRLRS